MTRLCFNGKAVATMYRYQVHARQYLKPSMLHMGDSMCTNDSQFRKFHRWDQWIHSNHSLALSATGSRQAHCQSKSRASFLSYQQDEHLADFSVPWNELGCISEGQFFSGFLGGSAFQRGVIKYMQLYCYFQSSNWNHCWHLAYLLLSQIICINKNTYFDSQLWYWLLMQL